MFYKSLIFFISVAAIISGCNSNARDVPPQTQATSLPVIKVEKRDLISYKSYPASIEGVVNSDVRAKVSGYVQEVLIDEGQAVKKGQPLFRLETMTLNQDAEAAQAQVQAAQVEVDKLIPLVEKGIISKVQLETAKANLAQARSRYNSVAANIGYGTIKSPVDGFAGAINYRSGALVSPSDPTPLTTVSDIENVYAYFSMNEKEYLDFLQNTEGKDLSEKIGNFPRVRLELANNSLYAEEGTIETVTGQINKSTGTVSFRAVFSNPNQLLTNGNSGKIRVPVYYKDVTVVPEVSTYEQQGSVFVYRIRDNKAVSSMIKVKERVDGLVIVNSGISPGDEIIGKGVAKVRNNMEIAPQAVSFDSISSFKTVFK